MERLSRKGNVSLYHVKYIMLSGERTAKALIRLHGYAGLSVPLFYVSNKIIFSPDKGPFEESFLHTG